MHKYLLLVLLGILSLFLTACQSNYTPEAYRTPPYVKPDGSDTVAGVPVYPGAVAIPEQRGRYSNHLIMVYEVPNEPSQVASTLKQLLIQYGFNDVSRDRNSKDEDLVVGRKPEVVALLTISKSGAGKSNIVYNLLLRSPGGS